MAILSDEFIFEYTRAELSLNALKWSFRVFRELRRFIVNFEYFSSLSFRSNFYFFEDALVHLSIDVIIFLIHKGFKSALESSV